MSLRARVQHRAFESTAQEAVVSLLVASAHVLQRMNAVLRAADVASVRSADFDLIDARDRNIDDSLDLVAIAVRP